MVQKNLFPEPLSFLTAPQLIMVETRMVRIAVRFALLGRIDTARHIVETLYLRPTLQGRDATGLRALVGFWHLTKFPAGTPESMKTDAYFKDLKNEEIPWPDYVAKADRNEDEAGLAAVLSKRPEHNWYATLSLRKALDIAVKVAEDKGRDPTNDTKVREVLAWAAEHLPSTIHDSKLVQIPRCYSLFMTGAVAKALNLSDQELNKYAVELVEAFRRRYLHGPTQQDATSIPDLMQTCSNLTVANTNTDDYRAEMGEDGPETLFQAPASDNDISELEKQLEIGLPEDFKTFLRHSNGFGGIWNGYFPGPPIEPTETIAWLEYSEYEFPYDQLHLPHSAVFRKGPKTGQFERRISPPIFSDVVLIASVDIDDVWLIPPKLMQEGRDYCKKIYNLANDEEKRKIERAVEDFAGSWEEWEKLEWGCTYWASGGVAQLDNYKSFKAWLEDKAWDARYAQGSG